MHAHLWPRHEPAPAHFLPVSAPLRSLHFFPIATTADAPTSFKFYRVIITTINPARGHDPSTLASHLYGPWHVVFVQEGAGSVTLRSVAENFHEIAEHHCAMLLDKDTFDDNGSLHASLTRTRSTTTVPCTHRYSSWAVEGVVVTGKFHKPLDPACQFFTVANIHVNNECAKRMFVCIALSSATCASNWARSC